MKTVLFIPGFKETLNTRDYASVLKMIQSKGYKTKFIPLKWDRSTIDNWTDEAMVVYTEYDPSVIILAGFSYGAMSAFNLASVRNPAELWLFSLSGYFKEDINSKAMNKSWLTSIGHRRVTAFDKLDYKSAAKRIHCPVKLFAGQIEIDKWLTMKYRTYDAPKHLDKSSLTIVEGVGHDVADTKYIDAISKLI